MHKISNYEIENIFYDLSKKFIFPKYKNLNSDDLKRKKNKDLVTSVDIRIEEYLRIVLKKLIKNSNFIGEESYEKNKKIINLYSENNYCWTVDPIDGTNNFARGNDRFAIMIALSYGYKILQSWIYIPVTKELYFANYGEGSFLKKQKLNTNNTSKLINSKGSISKKYWNEKNFKKIQKIKTKFKSVNSYGCIGLEYVDISKGKRDFAILSKLSPWDHLPGILLLRESGGSDKYFDKGNYNFHLKKNNLVVASNKDLSSKILNSIKE